MKRDTSQPPRLSPTDPHETTRGLSVRYEDLIKDPQEVLAKITRFCELPAFDYITDRLEKNTALKHHARMTPELRASIFALAGPVLRQFGYNDGTSSRRGICDK